MADIEIYLGVFKCRIIAKLKPYWFICYISFDNVLKTADAKCNKEAKCRIAIKAALRKLKNVLCNIFLWIGLRKKTHVSYIESIIQNGSGSRTIRRAAKANVVAAEMLLYRRILRTPWTD